MNGYYSIKQSVIMRDLGGLSRAYYLTESGKVVEVTQIGDNPPSFDDVHNLGPVLRIAYDYEIDMYKEKSCQIESGEDKWIIL